MIQFIIGITGGSGSGKTSLIRHIYDEFGQEVSTFSLDNYYLPKLQQQTDEAGEINFDLPSALDVSMMREDLNQLMSGGLVQHKQYGFNHPESSQHLITLEPRTILLIEGIFTMHYEFIRERLDFSIFIELDERIQLERRLKRDMEERNYSREQILYQWENHVKPAYRNFVLPYRAQADFILTNNEGFDQKLDELMTLLKKKSNIRTKQNYLNDDRSVQ